MSTSVRWRLAVPLGLVVGACGAQDPSPIAEDAGEPVVPPAIATPAPPALPLLTPCPKGWAAVADEPEGVVICEPFPSGEVPACEEGAAQFPGATDCAQIGAACPKDGWPDAVTGPALYVRQGTPAGGDGSRGAPFGTIGDALGRASPGTTVAVSVGRYDEALVIPQGVTLVGACASGTVLGSGSPADESSIVIASGSVTVRNVQVTGARPGFEVGPEPATLELEDVFVVRAQRAGLIVSGAGSLVARSVLIQGTRGVGVELTSGGRASLHRVALVENLYAAVRASGAATEVLIEDASITDTNPFDGDTAYGVQVSDGAHAIVRRSALVRNRGAGVACRTSATVDASDIVVRLTYPSYSAYAPESPADNTGAGLVASDGCHVTAARVYIDRASDTAVRARGRGSLSLTDAVLREPMPLFFTIGGALERGSGARVSDSSSADFVRVVVERHFGSGFVVNASHATLIDVTLRDARPNVANSGPGVDVEEGAYARLERVSLDGHPEIGLMVNGPGTQVDIEDLSVRNILPGVNGFLGYGVTVQAAAIANIARLTVERTFGVALQSRSSADVVASDVALSHTASLACATNICAERSAGFGLTVAEDARLEMTRFRVSDHALCGVQVAGNAQLEMHEGEVSNNPIGVNLQAPGFDLARISDRVIYRDNGTNLDVSTLPLPPAAVPASD